MSWQPLKDLPALVSAVLSTKFSGSEPLKFDTILSPSGSFMASENVCPAARICGDPSLSNSRCVLSSTTLDCFVKSSALLGRRVGFFWLPDWRFALPESADFDVFPLLSPSEISGRTLYLLLASLAVLSCLERPMSLGKLTLLFFKSAICLTPAFRLSFTISMAIRSSILIGRSYFNKELGTRRKYAARKTKLLL